MNSLRARLNTATSNAHAEVEATPFYTQLLNEELPKASALAYLYSLFLLHESLERSLFESSEPRIKAMPVAQMVKLPYLCKDLESFGTSSVPTALIEVKQFTDRINQDAVDPIKLLGYLYVFEGSQNGGLVLKKYFAKSLGVAPEDLTYFGCYGSATRQCWQRFVGHLDATVVTEEECRQIELSALSAFAGIRAILLAITP